MILKHPRQTFFSMTLTTLLSPLQWSNHTKIKGSAFQWVTPSSCLVLSRSISWTSFGESASMEVSRKIVERFGCGKRRVVNELGHHMSLVCFETWTAKAGHPAASISWVYKLSLLHSAWTEVLPGMDMWDRQWKKWRFLDHKWGMIEGFIEMQKEKALNDRLLAIINIWDAATKIIP